MFFTDKKWEVIQKWITDKIEEKLGDATRVLDDNIEKLDQRVIGFKSVVSDIDDGFSKRIAELEATVAELNHLRNRKDSDEPWFEFVGGDVDPEHGLELRLDWNHAFIKQLKLQGYKGTSDDELIAQYIANVQKTVDANKD